MEQATDIKRLADGSIDYSHYIAKSHAIRSNDTHKALATIKRRLGLYWKATKRHMTFRRARNRAQGVH